MRTTTMQDIARAAGVSLATVGRVLHGGYVSAEKREKIERAIADLNYIPNRSASNLKRSDSLTIGHLMRYNPNGLHAQINRHLTESARQRGYDVASATIYTDSGLEQARELVSQRVDGIIISCGSMMREDEILSLTDMGVPLVMVERWVDLPKVDRVVNNDLLGARTAVERMIAAGRRHIGYVGPRFTASIERDRHQGWKDALEQAGLPEGPSVLTEDFMADMGRAAAERILDSGAACDGIFCASDILAAGVMQALYAAGLRVPDDVLMTGYDNTIAELLSPRIASVALDYETVCERAMDLLLRRISDPDLPAQEAVVDPVYTDHQEGSFHHE